MTWSEWMPLRKHLMTSICKCFACFEDFKLARSASDFFMCESAAILDRRQGYLSFDQV